MLLEKHIDGLYFYKYDVDEELPFSNSFSDVVTYISALEHYFFNLPNVINEIRRALKPSFYCKVPNVACFPL